VPLEVLAQDDLGLTELKLQYRTTPENPWADLPLASFPAHPRDARVQAHWDASPLALQPGQSADLPFVVFDDNAVTGRGRTMSPEFQLRFPSLADLYQNVEEKQTGAQNTLERVADQARELPEVAPTRCRASKRRKSRRPGANFERSEEMRGAMQRQQEIGRQIDQAAQQLQQSIEDANGAQRVRPGPHAQAEPGAAADGADPVARVQGRAAQDAAGAREPRPPRTRAQMPEWRAENKDLVENLERTLDC
jgi:hypothetical protein